MEHFSPAGPFPPSAIAGQMESQHRSSLVWTEGQFGRNSAVVKGGTSFTFRMELGARIGHELHSFRSQPRPSFPLGLMVAREFWVRPRFLLCWEEPPHWHSSIAASLNLGLRDVRGPVRDNYRRPPAGFWDFGAEDGPENLMERWRRSDTVANGRNHRRFSTAFSSNNLAPDTSGNCT